MTMQTFGHFGDKFNLKFYIGLGMMGSALALFIISILASTNVLSLVNFFLIKKSPYL